jgi:hypothetical protein
VDAGTETRETAPFQSFRVSRQAVAAAVDAGWTSRPEIIVTALEQNRLISSDFEEPSDGLEPSTPSLP